MGGQEPAHVPRCGRSARRHNRSPDGDRRAQYEAYKLQVAASELAKRFEGRIQDEVYEAMQQTLVSNLRGQLQQQGIPFEQFVQSQGGEQQFGMIMMMQTREMLVQGYALDALFRHEKMTLTDEDIDAACRSMNRRTRTP